MVSSKLLKKKAAVLFWCFVLFSSGLETQNTKTKLKLVFSEQQLHWNSPKSFKDIVVAKIVDFKRQSAEMHIASKFNSKQELKTLLLSTHKHAQIASEAALRQPAVNTEFMEQFYSPKEDMATVTTFITKLDKTPNTNKQKRQHKPLRDCANADVYQFLMTRKRPKGATRFVWSRKRSDKKNIHRKSHLE